MKNLLLFSLLSLYLQASLPLQQSTSDRTITGRVIDVTNQPLVFANVQLVDFGQGTITDLDGRFSVQVPFNCHWIEVSYTGYSTQRFNIDGVDSLTVMMQAGVILQDVVVVDYKVPLIECDNTTQGGVRPTEKLNVRGSRSNATDYYIDGIRMNSSQKQKSEKQKNSTQSTAVTTPSTSVVTSGPSQYHTEDYSLIVENTFHHPKDAPLSTFSIDVDRASYANLRRYLSVGQLPPRDAVRIEEMINYFDYDYPQPKKDAPFSITTASGRCPWNRDHFLVHIGLQGKIIPADDLPASNFVFLIDVSGSMNAQNKLPLVISSLTILTEELRDKDRVSIVVYAGSSGLVLPSTPGNQKEVILSTLNDLRAGGSTAGGEGIQLAYTIARQNFIEGGNNRVILATDGDFNVGVSSDAELVRLIEKERESGVFLSVLGFGDGNYMDNKMQELADHGNGNHSFIDNINEARKVFVNEFGGTLFAIAKDVKIQVEFNPAHVQAYRLVGYENRVMQAEDFNDDKKDAGEIGSGHTVTALYEIIPVGSEPELMASVDPLKYQTINVGTPIAFNDEWMTVKIRYKEPGGNTSKLLEHIIYAGDNNSNAFSENFRWSAAVALFGMLLHESKYANGTNCDDVIKLAEGAVGKDEFGYRKEFLQLVRGISPLVKISKQTED